MFKSTVVAVSAAGLLVFQALLPAQVRQYRLESIEALTLHNVSAQPATLQGKKGVRLTLSEDAKRTLESLPPAARDGARAEQLAVIKDLEFSNGIIEVELAGAPAPDAGEGARGFVGIAFRLQPDKSSYDAFYLRPTNGRADDQERRNRSVQYISHPDWPWFRLRKETPGRYESYADLVPGQWTKVKIDVRGAAGRLYVHDSTQPTLIVNDMKSGADGKGALALWLDAGTVAHFRNLTVNLTPGG
jgi:hypothetical protein